jgi:hypothetical protein
LRDAQIELADAGSQAFGFEAVGIVAPLCGAFIGFGVEKVLPFKAHGGIQENAKASRKESLPD